MEQECFWECRSNIKALKDRIEQLETRLQSQFSNEDEIDMLVAKDELAVWMNKEENKLTQNFKDLWIDKERPVVIFFVPCKRRSLILLRR